ncbi:MAG: DUF1289 domain-containing protein [Halopseudomonas sp.]|uniref:DUF1289 domain-containing protein n=1 Tax=Halopseudomonas sp. TaxID=2901191 RepID=UPI0030025CCD
MTARGSQASPCVRRCCLDGDQCLGCGRMMSEILEWANASDARQCEIIAAAGERLQQREQRRAGL